MIVLVSVIAVVVLASWMFMQQKSFGKNPQGARLERIKQSPHYKDGKFVVQPEIGKTPKNAPMGKMLREFVKKHITNPDFKIPAIKTDLHQSVTDRPVIIWFGHSSYLIKIGGKNILVDPVLSERTSPVSYIGSRNFDGTKIYAASDFPEIDVLVITHDHYDHLDYQSMLDLKPKVKQIITSLGVGSHLEYWGYDTAKIKELDWGESANIDGLSLTATPAIHFSGRGLVRDKTFWSSFVLKAGGASIFIGGDSGYAEHYKKIGEQYGPFDIALLECGQYNELWPDIHQMPEQTAQAAADLNTEILMPVHWGKFALGFHEWNEPIKRVTAKAKELGIKVTTPKIGELVVVDSLYPETVWWERSQN